MAILPEVQIGQDSSDKRAAQDQDNDPTVSEGSKGAGSGDNKPEDSNGGTP